MKPASIFVFLAALLLSASRSEAQGDLPIYIDSLEQEWANWSWAEVGTSSTVVHSGSAALSIQADAWEGAYFHHKALDAAGFQSLEFWIHGGTQGGQKLLVQGLLSGKAQSATNLPPLPPNAWTQVSIPLTVLGVAGATDLDGFWVQDRTGTSQLSFFLDDMLLKAGSNPSPATNGTLQVLVNLQGDRHPISPWIYGLAFASKEQLRDLNAVVNRSGGNAESRYNWQLNAHNRGADWYFESLADSSSTPGAETDGFVADTLSGGVEAMVTIPLLGWAAKLGPNRGRLSSYSIAKYGPQTGSDAQWFPDAGNGLRASDGKPILNDPQDANIPVDPDFQSNWVQHLLTRWKPSAQGGVRWYCMDNEPSIWHSSHRDVQPVGLTMRELRDKFFAYAGMVKALDKDARIAAPEEWGWSGYFYSGFDQQAGAANGWRAFPDRNTNGGWDYLPWFLDQLRARADETGQRLLDIFTVHVYPQGGEFGGSTATAMQEKRNRSTRSLWDTQYVDESWINDRVMLIPRLKQWVNRYYPGTPIGLTEYNWGAEDHINGATAQADLLGIFGREGLDLATRWTTPPTGSPVYNAFKMFRNYDGKRSTFGDVSVQASGPNPDLLSAFAAAHSLDGSLNVMLVHKRLDGISPVAVQLTNAPSTGTAKVWQLARNNTISALPDISFADATLRLALPAQSITLLVIPGESRPRLNWIRSAHSATVSFGLEGSTNRLYLFQQSDDLAHWTTLSTNPGAASLPLTLSTSEAPQRFLRAVSQP